MKRKIAAIFAADIAGYSRLVAEDEEETLRRLASYRSVVDDFIAKANGRIFNTAGDAVLAEFPSAVDAVRCAIDIQESLRTRNMAYPPSRQMSFRIGITIGDVVERDGDLLGDGVNIAARLEGLAEVGGICVSRAVHEQVANKLSVHFADIGAQEVTTQSTTIAAMPPPMTSPLAASGGKIPVDAVPFIGERLRAYLSNEYAAAGDYKAFALNIGGFTGSSLGQPNEEAARNAALDQCQKRADAAQNPRRCELYAVGNKVVYSHGSPPMPPQPWVRHDTMTERPFASKDFPMLRDQARTRVENIYGPAAKSRSVALGPGGQYFMVLGASSVDETTRRSLESCGALAGSACMIVAVDDNFVVPIPTLLKPNGFFHAATNASIVADARDDVVRKLGDGMGWNAVAVGTAGRPGLGLRAADEQTAVNGALADCVKHDSDCHVIAIGPFTVGPTN